MGLFINIHLTKQQQKHAWVNSCPTCKFTTSSKRSRKIIEELDSFLGRWGRNDLIQFCFDILSWGLSFKFMFLSSQKSSTAGQIFRSYTVGKILLLILMLLIVTVESKTLFWSSLKRDSPLHLQERMTSTCAFFSKVQINTG